MFTGIVEEIGKVNSLCINGNSGQINIRAVKVLEDTKIGDSICVNGVCLTVIKIGRDCFTADIMAETARRSNLGKLKYGDFVNLERALQAGGRFGGHIVSGHIDGVGNILSKNVEENAVWVKIAADMDIIGLIVQKGSIAIDGISLTVADVCDKDFSVSVIPHTAGETTLLNKNVGEEVNLENDVVGKYVERLLFIKEGEKKQNSMLTMEMLRDYEI